MAERVCERQRWRGTQRVGRLTDGSEPGVGSAVVKSRGVVLRGRCQGVWLRDALTGVREMFWRWRHDRRRLAASRFRGDVFLGPTCLQGSVGKGGIAG
ncbi:hypothetical protein E2562_005752 [Oryza meyeriana var. granulata]|uniref:Uncharacterized protein n=1 Tax=Oryza meyeriana var. granulata TaxID=110450 RepID=A0A6G1F4E1_9ORYZ|nr:hypothetical protein E2562_005752 [Oryza meyeriana var. granulata]